MIETIILYLLSFLLIWQFGGYQLLMATVASVAKPNEKITSRFPFVSIIVAAYNEEKDIQNRINNLLELDYPKENYEIIVVESGSTDSTYSIVKNIIESRKDEKYPNILLLTEEKRNGKGSAINFGQKNARGEIIVSTDANTVFEKTLLKKIVPHFEDKSVGGVSGRYIVSDSNNDISFSESFRWELESLMRSGESVFGSVCALHGEMAAWRKGTVEADTRMILEDLDMAVQLKKKGYKIEYEPKAIYFEPAAGNHGDYLIQKKKIITGRIQCFLHHIGYFLLPLDIYRILVFPSRRTLSIFSPFLFLLYPILWIIIANPVTIVINLLVTMLCFAGIMSTLMLFKPKKVGKTQKTIGKKIHVLKYPSSLIKIASHVIFIEFIILFGWKDYLSGNYSVLWEKAQSTRNKSTRI